jgi:hydroxyacylglutathione hydrolase
MTQNIKNLQLPLPLIIGKVNCCLIEVQDGFILIDTGSSNARQKLEKALADQGCQPGDLKLISITHGDFDHIGYAAHLRDKYAVKIVMHEDDIAMAKNGEMLANRRNSSLFYQLIAFLTPKLMGYGDSEKFDPDMVLNEEENLSDYGFDAKVLSIPGHSSGSIGFLTDDGDLFCGDLLENRDHPKLSSIMDDMNTAQSSLDQLKTYQINMVYPGHREPFPIDSLLIT